MFRNCILLGHDVSDLQSELNHQFGMLSLRFEARPIFFVCRRRRQRADLTFRHNGLSIIMTT